MAIANRPELARIDCRSSQFSLVSAASWEIKRIILSRSTRFCQRQNFLSLTMIQPPVVSSVVVVVVVGVGVSVQIKNGITF